MGDFRGVPIDSLTSWSYPTPPIRPNSYHKVLFEFPIDLKSIPKSHLNYKHTFNAADHVRLPYIEKDGAHPDRKPYWEFVQEALLQPIRNSRQLEAVIRSYLGHGAKFSALHYLFELNFTEDESEEFFRNVLPEIIQLALNLPTILPGNLPYLKSGSNKSISLSQHQISSLLANAFLCTYHHRDKNSKDNNNAQIRVPGINFDRLFAEFTSKDSAVEKIKCMVYYFKRIVTETPFGVVTFERKHVRLGQLPKCDGEYSPIKMKNVHISSHGTIEDNGQGLLQVDFANKFIGGGVLGHGCVQEEIRFVICPELIISRLFTEELRENEALLMIGAEQFSKYTGYGDTFKWAGGFTDQTPYDAINGRRQTSIIAIDAVHFVNTRHQFKPGWIRREIHKAYVGFHQYQEKDDSGTALPRLAPVATGNWGCGAFRGEPHLKWLIQLMAATMAKRDLVYYTFNNRELMNELWAMYKWIAAENISVKQLWRLLCTFMSTDLPAEKLFQHIQETYLKSKSQPSVVDVFKKTMEKALTSKTDKPEYPKLNFPQVFEKATSSKSKDDEARDNSEIRKPRHTENMDVDEIVTVHSDFDDSSMDTLDLLSTSKRKLFINEQHTSKSSQNNEDRENGLAIKNQKSDSKNTSQDDVLDIINLLHGDKNDNHTSKTVNNDDKVSHSTTQTLFEVVDALSTKKSKNASSDEILAGVSVNVNKNDSSSDDVHTNIMGNLNSSTLTAGHKNKITDYFCRVDKNFMSKK